MDKEVHIYCEWETNYMRRIKYVGCETLVYMMKGKKGKIWGYNEEEYTILDGTDTHENDMIL